MRKLIPIALGAATALTSPAYAFDRHHERHERAEVRHEVRHAEVRHPRRHIVYVAPVRGWHYRRVPVGYRLQPAFYGSRYYVTDYGYYNIGAPGRYERWVRYGYDLLLVNIRTGRVLRVIPGVFYY